MLEDVINIKLSRELSNLPIDTEPRVVYLLVEIRKVLEHKNIRDTLLCFYCDWVVHTRMDRRFANNLFNEIDNDNSNVGHHIKSFNLLKNELKMFFEAHDLPIELINTHWETFRDRLLDVLIDTPIFNTTKDKSFGFSKKDGLGGVQYYIKENGNFRLLGRVWI